jgi:SAM-dependent methyltransferase
MRELASATWSAMLELLPSRRKAAFGDLDYDWEHSVDTTRSNVGAGTQFLTGVMARPYFATEPWLFEQIMQAISVDFSQFTFVDLGCGKGRVLLMASDYPFQRIVGVEFMPELHRAAEKYRWLFQRSAAVPANRSRLCGRTGFSVSARAAGGVLVQSFF